MDSFRCSGSVSVSLSRCILYICFFIQRKPPFISPSGGFFCDDLDMYFDSALGNVELISHSLIGIAGNTKIVYLALPRC